MTWVLSLMHPSAILRGQWREEPAQIEYLKRVREFLEGTYTPDDYSSPPPGSLVFPTLGTLQDFDDVSDRYDSLALDIENAGRFLLCIGLTWYNQSGPPVGPTLVLPFRAHMGVRYWSWGDHVLATQYLDTWLSGRHTKVFHNGVTHDVPLLRGMGFEVQGPWMDTMYQVHWLYPEMRKGLQYCCTLHLGSPVWKTLTDEDDEEEGKA